MYSMGGGGLWGVERDFNVKLKLQAQQQEQYLGNLYYSGCMIFCMHDF